MNNDINEGAISVALMTAPAWVRLLIEVNLVASTVAAVCGALIGLHTIWKIWKRHRAGGR
jgi:hypothetical protein